MEDSSRRLGSSSRGAPFLSSGFGNDIKDIKWIFAVCGDGLTTRPISGSDEIQLRIVPMHADLDEEITGLYSHVKRLRNVAEEIGTEAKFQNDFPNQLQLTMIKAHAEAKNNVRKLNKTIIRNGPNSVVHVAVFALGVKKIRHFMVLFYDN